MTNYIETFNKLEIDKSIKKNTNNDYPGIQLYKYGRHIFYDGLWNQLGSEIENKILSLARGIVIDEKGNLVSFPFEKVYNYGEKIENINTKPNKEKEYIFVEKLNGFLGVISQDPFDINKLLIHTQGSIKNNDYVEYIKELLTKEQEQSLINYMKKYGKHTFMFEVIHPNDPHIVIYDEKDFGLWLIGVRNIENNDIDNSYLYTEDEVDNINDFMKSELLDKGGIFKRPSFFIDNLSNILQKIKDNQYYNLEGFMIRDIDSGKFLSKLKTPNYLMAKFLGRMNDKRYEQLINDTDQFKKNHSVEEEFYPIIDFILENKVWFLSLSKEERVLAITNFINNNY